MTDFLRRPDGSERTALLLHERQFSKSSEVLDRPTISILNGNRFMVSSKTGDLTDEGHGVFSDDTRLLSRFKAEINGTQPISLTASNTTHYSAVFYLTNPELHPARERGDDDGRKSKAQGAASYRDVVYEIPREKLAIHRMRFIEQDVREEYLITNSFEKTVGFNLSFEVDSDFSDIFEVKSRVFADQSDELGPSSRVRGRVGVQLRRRGESSRNSDGQVSITRRFFDKKENAFDLVYADTSSGFEARTLVWFSRMGHVLRVPKRGAGQRIHFEVLLRPKQQYRLTMVIVLLSRGQRRKRRYNDQYFRNQKDKVEQAMQRWALAVPILETNWDELRHSYYQSVIDLTSLRMSDPTNPENWELPAAGCPWFMTVFGRDTLVTAYQSIIFGSKLAMGAVDALSKYQGKGVDDSRDEEPGKIMHEIRFGRYASASGRFPYYGTADATPLFLILASEVYRWTGDKEFINRHKGNIVNALHWIDNYGDRDGDGFVEYAKKSSDGLDNQCWKDSWDSIRFTEGKIAKPPIATCEIQGYVYDAKMRVAELAREVWRDESSSKLLRDQARRLKRLFNERFWIEDKGYYALALDGGKRQVDSMTSNNGHLLWSGIVDDSRRVEAVTEHLMSDAMFSGYGIRTMSTESGGYNPIGYHTGCVWPHDNSLIAEGLARYGRGREATRVIDGMLEASHRFGYTLPEVFAGFQRLKEGFPAKYPTAASPQAWAAGASIHFLRTLLGLNPSRGDSIKIDPILAYGDTGIRVSGLKAFGKDWNISVEGRKKTAKIETRRVHSKSKTIC